MVKGVAACVMLCSDVMVEGVDASGMLCSAVTVLGTGMMRGREE